MITHAAYRTGANLQPSRRARAVSFLLPERPAARFRLYVFLTVLLYLAAWVLVLARAHVKQTTVDFALADAVGFYAYLPSVIIDGDLNFDNQLEIQFRGNVPSDFGAAAGGNGGWSVAVRKNRWPIGVALSLAPAFLAAHASSLVLYALTGADAFRPDGYSILYWIFCVAAAMAIGTAGMIAADWLIVERYGIPGRCAAAAVLTWWLGTNYLWFYVREPLIGHMIGASWLIFAGWLVHRIERDARDSTLRWWTLPALVFVSSMAVVCRFTNVVIVPLCAYALIVLARQRLLGRALRQAPFILAALSPLILQAALWYTMIGQAVPADAQTLGYTRRERFFWTRPALVLSLFSSRRGLFFWTPLLLLSVWGLIWHMLRRRGWRDPWLACFVLAAVAVWYINASWYAWWLGNSAGNRGFIELAGLFILGFGFAYTWLEQLGAWQRRTVLGLILAGAMVNFALIGLKMLNRLDGHGPLLSFEKRLFTGRWERF